MNAELRGLTADWLNGWLAALGITVLLRDCRLSWSNDAVPTAVLHDEAPMPTAPRVWAALPSAEDLSASPIARHLAAAAHEMPRNFELDVYRERAIWERRAEHPSLAVSTTDLVNLKEGESLPHGPFDVPVPRGITLHERVMTSLESIDDEAHVDAGLRGSLAALRQHNGLGFDARRLVPGEQSAEKVWVNPVVEVLAYFGLTFFPLRGDGRNRVRARGWEAAPSRMGAFSWSTWSEPLDRWAIDALLDLHHAGRRTGGRSFESVPYRTNSSSDTTRAYASRERGR